MAVLPGKCSLSVMTHRKLAACAAVAALAGGGCSALHHDQRSSYTLHSPLAVDDAR